MNAISVRPRAVYGPQLDLAEARALPSHHLVLDVLDGKPVRKESGRDSSLDFTYVKDEARGIIQAYDCKSPSFYVYNLSYGNNVSTGEVCEVLKKLFPNVPIEIGPGQWGRHARQGQANRPHLSQFAAPAAGHYQGKKRLWL